MKLKTVELFISLFFMAFFGANTLSAQTNIDRLRTVTKQLKANPIKETSVDYYGSSSTITNSSVSSSPALLFKSLKLSAIPKSTDLIIGDTPGEVFDVSGSWNFSGDIFVVGDGQLNFNNAHSEIIGNIYAMNEARVVIQNSEMFFPQQYFYQRLWALSGTAELIVSNSQLYFGGMVHNMVFSGQSKYKVVNSTCPDFTTTLVADKASIDIDGIDVAGEFIVSDSSQLSFKNASTILLWHHFPSSSIIDHEFPSGDSLNYYHFDAFSVGVSGIHYSITVDSCSNVMWGIMQEPNSNVQLRNSELRTIGLWFQGNDSTNVSGLVDNSQYSSYNANLSDRVLFFENCSVKTWSLYLFDDAFVSLSGSIVGEVGTMGRSQLNGQNHWVDGSGGYVFANDTSSCFFGYTNNTCHVRSDDHAILILAQASQSMGRCSAIGESLMLILQSQINGDPILYDSSSIWMAYIGEPAFAYVDSLIPLPGDAWIENGMHSDWPNFGGYILEFKRNTQNDNWLPIGSFNSQIHHGVIALWNTDGLSPDSYIIRMRFFDDHQDTVDIEKSIVHLPKSLSANFHPYSESKHSISPNPCRRGTYLQLADILLSTDDIELVNLLSASLTLPVINQQVFIPSEIPTGVYYVKGIDYKGDAFFIPLIVL